MSIVFSHILAFCVLFVGAVFDLKTTEVPDILNVTGVAGGILLHLYASIPFMDFQTVFSTALFFRPVEWFGALGEPLMWSLGVGIIFSVYGWGSFLLGLWGGADAFAMSVLGFAAPYSVAGPTMLYPVSLLAATLGLGMLYTLVYGFLHAVRNREVFQETKKEFLENERRIALEVVLASLISGFAAFQSLSLGLAYFGLFLVLVFLLRFFHVIQREGMQKEVNVSELEGGEVIGTAELDMLGQLRRKNLFGRLLESTRAIFQERRLLRPFESLLRSLEERVGYPEVVGVTGEQLEKLEQSDVEKVKVKKGVKFIPVFPAALFLVDVLGFSISWVFLLFS